MGTRYRVTASGVELGWVLFEGADASMAMVFGRFEPGAAYTDRAGLFTSLSRALDRKAPECGELLAQREKLRLELFTEEGAEIKTEWIMIFDYADEHERAFEAKMSSAQDLHAHFGDDQRGTSW